MHNLLILATEVASTDAYNSTATTLMSTGMIVVVIIFFVVFVMIPQKNRDKQLKKQITGMRPGDTVVTIGGVVGEVANVDEDSFTISTSKAYTLITFQKSTIASVVSRDGQAANELALKAKKEEQAAKEKAKADKKAAKEAAKEAAKKGE